MNTKKYKYLILIVLILFSNLYVVSQIRIQIDSTFLNAGTFPKNHLVTHKIGIDYIDGERNTVLFKEIQRSRYNTKGPKIVCHQAEYGIGVEKNKRRFFDIIFLTNNTEGNYNAIIKIKSIASVDTTIVIKINYTVSSEDSKYNFNKINLEKQGGDSIKLTITGLYQTTGCCDKSYPLLWIEKQINNNWEIYNQYPSVDCGVQTILVKDRSYYYKLSDFRLETGTYRLVVHPKHKKRMHSKSFFISANNN